jgi:uncharacterized membrane protein YdbT with pleckstrin-like domain
MTQSSKEQEEYQGKMHTIVFAGPIFLLFIGVIGQELIPEIKVLVHFVDIFAIGWFFAVWINYYFSSLTIKKNRIILQTGWLVRQTMDIPLTKIESLDIRQNILGSILNYGDLLIIGTGGSRAVMPHLNKPLTCRRHIEQLMNYPE